MIVYVSTDIERWNLTADEMLALHRYKMKLPFVAVKLWLRSPRVAP